MSVEENGWISFRKICSLTKSANALGTQCYCYLISCATWKEPHRSWISNNLPAPSHFIRPPTNNQRRVGGDGEQDFENQK